jgi:uncharacterized protein YjbI with pentapeptide repeats
VYLINVHLTGVNLAGVHLMGVYLMGVHLTGVYLTGVHLTGVYLTGVHLKRKKVVITEVIFEISTENLKLKFITLMDRLVDGVPASAVVKDDQTVVCGGPL